MRNFFDLVGFEYKKIFKQKSAVVSLLLVTAVVCAVPLMVLFGPESRYQEMLRDREYARALSGRAIDETLLKETRDAYSKFPAVELWWTTPEYHQYARPYLEIYTQMYAAYDTNVEKVRTLTDADLSNFYQVRHDKVSDNIRSSAISDAAKDAIIKLDSEISTPFIFEWSRGFDILLGCISSIGIACAFALAVCLAPLFAGEYSTRVDQLILSSRWGKNKQITAKIFTAVSISLVFYLLLLVIAIFFCGAIYGFGNANAPFQLLIPSNPYPLTLLEAVTIFATCVFFGILLVVALTLLLSSKFKSPFGVIIIISLQLFVPMMFTYVGQSIVWLYNLFSLLPTNMMAIGVVFYVPFDFFGLIIPPQVFLPAFAIMASAVMLPFARRAFQRHQIG